MLTIEQLKAEKRLPAVLADHQGIVLYVNPVFETTYHWPAEVIVGKAINELIPHRLRDAHNMGFSRFLVTAKPKLLNQPLDLIILTGEGQELKAEHFIIAEIQDGKAVFGAIIRPPAAG